MHRNIYYFVFLITCLGVSFLIHAGVEILTLKIILGNLAVYENSFVWVHWGLVHQSASIALTTIAVVLALVYAPKCWKILYIDKKYGKPWL